MASRPAGGHLERQGALAAKRPRVALCHLESLVSLPALNALFAELGDQIGLIILSNRFGGKHGGAFRQLLKGIRRSGLRMTLWLGFDIIAARSVWRSAHAVKWLIGRTPTLQTVRDLAERYGASVLETGDVNSEETIGTVRRLGIDVVVAMNFDQIFGDNFIRSPQLAVVNVHPSLLPSLRGPCPVFWALVEKRREVGVTIHLIDSVEIDAGPIVVQRAIAGGVQQSVGELTSALFLAGVGSIKDVTERLAQGWRPHVNGRRGASDYRGLPSRVQMSTAAARRVRLCRLTHVSSLIRASAGLSSGRGS